MSRKKKEWENEQSQRDLWDVIKFINLYAYGRDKEWKTIWRNNGWNIPKFD